MDVIEDHGDLHRKVAKGAAWITIEMLAVQLCSFLVFAVTAHYVEPHDFGLMSICFLAIQTLQVLIIYTIPNVVARKRKPSAIDFTTTFWCVLGSSLIGFALLWTYAGAIEGLFGAPGLKPVLQAMSVILAFSGLSQTHEAWMRKHFQFRPMAFRGVAGAVAGGVVGCLLAMKGYGINALVIQQVTTGIVSLALLWMVCPWRPTIGISKETLREIKDYQAKVVANNIITMVNQNADTFLVAYVFGPVSAGLYAVAKRVRLALQMVVGTPLRGVTLAGLAELQDDKRKLHAGMVTSLKLLFALCGPVFVGTSAIAPEMIQLMFGAKWAAAAPALELLALGGFALILLQFCEYVFILRHKLLWSSYLSGLYTCLIVAAVFVCFRLGITQVALPFVAPYLIVFPVAAMMISRVVPVTGREWAQIVLPPVAAAAAMFMGVRELGEGLAQVQPILKVLLMAVEGGAIYGAVLWLFWRDTFNLVQKMLVSVVSRHIP